MQTHELRDAGQARRFLLQGICEQHVAPLTAETVKTGLSWALEAAASGQPLPPVGFLADLGHVAFGVEQGPRRAHARSGLPAGLARMYEDHVLGKLYSDWHFERASDALRRFQGRDRARGLAFVLNQFRERAEFPGVFLSPALIRGILEMPADEALASGLNARSGAGLMPLLLELYEGLIAALRRTGDVLGPEDVFELEHGTALADLGQRVALRQVLQAALRLEAALPAFRVRPLAGRQEVPTRVFDEDTYPVGGYSSLATRGSIESLLQSQLAYMEKDERDRPDLFDIKYLRDELLYYARDENQFLRRRRSFIIALSADLVQSRFKDSELPWQRIVLLLGFLVAAVRRLSDWLSTDALVFEFLFPVDGEVSPLAQERHLLEMVLREQRANGTVQLLAHSSRAQLADYLERRARLCMCHCLVVGTEDVPAFRAENTVVSRLQLGGPVPVLHVSGEAPDEPEPETLLKRWSTALERLLQVWV